MSLIALLAIFLLVGFFAGILIGMLGIGGGLVFVPALYYLLPLVNVPDSNLAYFAIGTSLFAGALATSSSAIINIRKKNYFKKPAILVASGAALTAFIAPFFVVKVKSEIIEFIFAIVMILIALRMIFENSKNDKFKLAQPLGTPFLFLLGILTGTLSAFTGLGGGVIYVPSLIYLFLINARVAVGTSAIITAITMIFATTSYIIQGTGSIVQPGSLGFIMPQVAIPFGIGAIVGSYFGNNIMMRTSTEIIKKAFAVLLIAAVAKIFFT